MAVINMSSILPKLNAFANSAKGKRVVGAAMKNAILKFGGGGSKHSPEEAAAKFVEIMQYSVQHVQAAGFRGGALGSTAVEALSNFEAGEPYTSNVNGELAVTIPFNFEGDLHRDSMIPGEQVENIVQLLNKGYSAHRAVYGKWHGEYRYGLMTRSGAGFIQGAVSLFMSQYAAEYNVIDIQIADGYE